ncbi:MAG: toprim domain-containing protein [Candidatus Aenigmatarchaeota archaeon]
MNKKIDIEEIESVLEKLKGNILIVEGKKDYDALRGLGLTHIVKVNSRHVIKVVEEAVSLRKKHKNRQVIVLTDFDREGRKLASRITLLLQSRKIHANSRIRRDVMRLGISRIEEMSCLRAEILKARDGTVSIIDENPKECDDYGEACADFNKICHKGKDKGKGCDRKARRDRGDIRANRRASRF